ncbi:MAG: substrate-binding domain-containing protein [Afipia sp.]|nr:substrate-binding domain-containing protein [Afipia sp.]
MGIVAASVVLIVTVPTRAQDSSTQTLHILSGGAAQSLIEELAPKFKVETGFSIVGQYGAVGTMADKLRSGEPADLVVLTTPVLNQLAKEKLLQAADYRNIGLVSTAVAVRITDRVPRIDNSESLRSAFLAADEIFLPDTKASTAGIHLAKVLTELNIADKVKDKVREFPAGRLAMKNLAASTAKNAIGATQTTEIVSTPGLRLVGALPKGFDLSSMYAATIPAKALNAAAAKSLIDLLCSDVQRRLREEKGFTTPN